MSEEKKVTNELIDDELDNVVGGKAKYYVVKKGDQLSDIAALYWTTVNQLCAWNNISNPNFIKVGDRLRVA